MSHRFADLAFTAAVKAVQEQYRSRSQNERLQQTGGPHDALSDAEASFIAERDSLYMATVSESGWPYVQHRGGPPGFLKVLGPKTLAFADFRGNTQFISAGNAAGNDRVSLIVMDYRHRQRLKLLGHIRFEDASRVDPATLKAVQLPGYRGRVERVALIEVEAFDWNCPQHITPRFTEAEIRAAVQPLHDHIAALEARLASLGAEVPS
jgi:predicted pyridoxine 5'-phosphate oxidase superfamily flavin-nucleotide-binding protein